MESVRMYRKRGRKRSVNTNPSRFWLMRFPFLSTTLKSYQYTQRGKYTSEGLNNYIALFRRRVNIKFTGGVCRTVKIGTISVCSYGKFSAFTCDCLGR